MEELHIWACALAFGITWGLAIFCLGISAALGRRSKLVDLIEAVYIGFDGTMRGSLIGAAWGFLDGALAGFLYAWLYNMFVRIF
jgi:hypothetical protein